MWIFEKKSQNCAFVIVQFKFDNPTSYVDSIEKEYQPDGTAHVS